MGPDPPPPGKFNFLKFKFLNSQIQNSHSKMTENMPRTPPPENLNIQISLGPPPPQQPPLLREKYGSAHDIPFLVFTSICIKQENNEWLLCIQSIKTDWWSALSIADSKTSTIN